MWRLSIVLTIFIFAAACSQSPAEGPEQPEEVQIEAVTSAEETLADDFDLDPASIELIKVEDATWTDSCLGLGQANESCLLEDTPGYTITLEAEGKQYVYRTDDTGLEVRLEQITE